MATKQCGRQKRTSQGRSLRNSIAGLSRYERRVLRFEPLEDRRMLSITVDTLVDESDGSIVDGDKSLRDVIAAATSGETIDFDASLAGGTITLSLGRLYIAQSLTIDARGIGGITIDADDQDRVFRITGDSNTEVTLSHLTITGGSGGGIYNSSGTLTVTDSMIKGNSADYSSGGGIYNSSGTVTVTNSTIVGNSATGTYSRGGGIYNGSGTLTVTDSTIVGNSTTTSNGGGIYGTVTLTNSIVALNTASNENEISGQISGSHNLIGLDPGFVRNPDAGADGTWGTADDDYGDLHLQDTSIAINRGDNTLAVDPLGNPLTTDLEGNPRISDGTVDLGAYEFQGAPSLSREAGSTEVTTLSDLDSSTDGETSIREALFYASPDRLGTDVTFALALTGGTITLAGRELGLYESMTIDAGGIGGITIDADDQDRVFRITGDSNTEVALSDLTITGGSTSSDGGGIYNGSGTLTVTNSTIVGNSTTGTYSRGGSIYNSSGTVTVTNSTIAGNASSGAGGGIFSQSGSVTVTGSTIADNSGGSGGGINSRSGTVTVTGSTISGNSTTSNGGGIYSGSSTLTVTNSTIVGNSASGTFSRGGGLYKGSGTVTMTNSTIVGNSAIGTSSRGGGIYNVSMLTVTNSIVALNTASNGNEISRQISGSHNLIGLDPGFVRNPDAGADGTWGTADDDYGDLHLQDTSIAINRGDNTLAVDPLGNPLTTDLEGNPRISDGTVDLGAYEFQGAPSLSREAGSTEVTTLSDLDSSTDGETSIREALFYASPDRLGTDVTFALALTGGTITLAGRELGLYESMTIDAGGIGGITIDAAGQSRVIYISEDSNTEVALSDLTITGGSTSSDGGGIYNRFGTLTVTNSTIVGNSATGFSFSSGGGIYNSSGTLTVTNSTIVGNSAIGTSSRGRGGGIYNSFGAVTVTNSTIAGNASSGAGGGILNPSGTVTLTNSIVAFNSSSTVGDDVFGAWSGSHNLIGLDPGFVRNPDAGADGTWGTADDDYGDLHLQDTSIAINRGDNTLAVDPLGNPLTTDLEGNPRISDGTVDLGAYEFQGAPSLSREAGSTEVTTLSDLDSSTDGETSIREALFYASPDRLGTDVTFALALTGGTITLAGRELGLYESMTIDAGGIGGITIHAAGQSRVIYISEDRNTEVALSGLTIAGGSTSSDGGGIYNGSGTLTVTDSTIFYNSGGFGGGIYNGSGTLTVTNSRIAYTRTSYGIYNESGTVTVTNSTIVNNSTTSTYSRGGGIYNESGTVTVTGCTIQNNGSGGGIYNDSGTVTVTGCTIADNWGGSGGIFNSGTLTVAGSTIVGNWAIAQGGGIFNCGTLTVTGSTIEGNSANATYSDGGGGIFNCGTLNVANSTISGNSTTSNGGGISNIYGTLTVTGSTIVGNSASGTFSRGGGLYKGSGTVTMTNSTIVGNSVTDANSRGGGIYSGYSTVMIHHTIVATNQRGSGEYSDIDGAVDSGSAYNLIGVDTGLSGITSGTAGNQIGTAALPIDPLLGPLADNGGPTKTLALLSGSLAIDAGDPSAVAGLGGVPFYDQRGFAYSRVVNGHIDIGAFESGAVSADFDSDGYIDGTDLGLWEVGYGTASGANFTDGDGDGDDDVDGFDFLAWQRGYNSVALPTPDFNADRYVDGTDLGLWEVGYGTASGATLTDGDGDGDGDVDGFDFLAWQRSYSPAPEPTADFDLDSYVDGGDFLTWQREYGTGTTLAEGDANGDSVVNGLDLAVWENQFGTGGAVTAIAAAEADTPLLESSEAIAAAVIEPAAVESAPLQEAATAVSESVAIEPASLQGAVSWWMNQELVEPTKRRSVNTANGDRIDAIGRERFFTRLAELPQVATMRFDVIAVSESTTSRESMEEDLFEVDWLLEFLDDENELHLARNT